MSRISAIVQTLKLELQSQSKTTIKRSLNTMLSQNNHTNKKMLPIVSVPIIAYNIDYGKITAESLKSYRPYTNAVQKAKKEFEDRDLPWNDQYADTLHGYLSIKGNSIISNYDENKQNFAKAGLNFSNNLINPSTGKLNLSGNTVWNNYTAAVNKLEEAHISYNQNFFDKRTGKLTSYYQNKLGFKGAPHDNTIDENLESTSESNSYIHDLNELDAIDTELCSELQEVYEAPPIETTEGIIETIFGELPDGVDIHWNFMSILKSIADEILDIEDWL